MCRDSFDMDIPIPPYPHVHPYAAFVAFWIQVHLRFDLAQGERVESSRPAVHSTSLPLDVWSLEHLLLERWWEAVNLWVSCRGNTESYSPEDWSVSNVEREIALASSVIRCLVLLSKYYLGQLPPLQCCHGSQSHPSVPLMAAAVTPVFSVSCCMRCRQPTHWQSVLLQVFRAEPGWGCLVPLTARFVPPRVRALRWTMGKLDVSLRWERLSDEKCGSVKRKCVTRDLHLHSILDEIQWSHRETTDVAAPVWEDSIWNCLVWSFTFPLCPSL